MDLIIQELDSGHRPRHSPCLHHIQTAAHIWGDSSWQVEVRGRSKSGSVSSGTAAGGLSASAVDSPKILASLNSNLLLDEAMTASMIGNAYGWDGHELNYGSERA
jgi:hypothetical protein